MGARVKFLLVFGVLGGITGLVGCSSDDYSPYGGTDEPRSVKIGKPYVIKGKRYYPAYDPDYNEVGEASWYGPNFHGRMTANGEKYDMYEMTAAHKTLPLPSIVRVTHTGTGKSIKVRVNDRGPFAHGRIIDLSKKAADSIGMIGSGVAKVRVEYLGIDTERYITGLGMPLPKWMKKSLPLDQKTYAAAPAEAIETKPLAKVPTVQRRLDKPAPTLAYDLNPAAGKPAEKASAFQVSYREPDVVKPVQVKAATTAYRVQTGSFGNRFNAERHADQMAEIANPAIREVEIAGKPYYRVSLGPVQSINAARNIVTSAKMLGAHDARIMVE